MNHLRIICANSYRKWVHLSPGMIKRSFADAKTVATSTSSSIPSVGSVTDKKSNLDAVKIDLERTDAVPTKIATPSSITEKTVVSFDEVPGPVVLRQISKIWSIIPAIGTQISAATVQYLLGAGKLFGGQMSWIGGNWIFKKLLDTYGPIVRLHGPFGGDVVILSRPEHVRALFNSEGPFPIRSSMNALEYYRLRTRRFKQAGPFIMYGPDWANLRKHIEAPLQESITKNETKVAKHCDELITRILSIRNQQDEVSTSFYEEIYKWSLECLFEVTINREMGFLDRYGLSQNSDASRLMHSFFKATAAIRKIEYGPHFFKLFNSWAWKDLVKSCEIMDGIVIKYIQRAQDLIITQKRVTASGEIVETKGGESTLLENLLIKEKILMGEVMTVLLDMMVIGVNATAHSVAYLLYDLAKSPRCQHLLHKEVLKFPDINAESVKKMQYLGNCIRESLRLHPPMPVLSRVLSKDVVIHNYKIPKDTFVLIATHSASLQEENFEDPYKFKPERWSNPENDFLGKDVTEFAALPFGYGAKACLAKEMAEVHIALLIAKIIKRFKVEYHYGDTRTTFDKFLSPHKRPNKFRFVDRT